MLHFLTHSVRFAFSPAGGLLGGQLAAAIGSGIDTVNSYVTICGHPCLPYSGTSKFLLCTVPNSGRSLNLTNIRNSPFT